MEKSEAQLTENEQIAQRKAKLAELRKAGIAFPNDFQPTALAVDVYAEFESKDHDALEKLQHKVKLAGRIMTRRLMGKASFLHIQDHSGKMQLYLRRDDLPEGVYEQFKRWDLGDIVGIEGMLFKTKTGELTVKLSNIRLLTKSLRPMPEKFHGLTDHETCYRQRYLDLMVNEKTRRVFKIRSDLMTAIRNFLHERGFVEVETPMMQKMAGGAAARPFVTHHNALDLDLYLRIAPELYLKRLVVGGVERVFEINRNFRNEGISTRHNPEFTMLEFYQAYANYKDLINLTEEMLREVAKKVLGTTKLVYQGAEFDLAKPFKRLTLHDAILEYSSDIKANDLADLKSAQKLAEKLGIPVHKNYGLGRVQYEIFDKTTEKKLIDPTFITSYPAEVSPLARKNDKDPFVTDRFEFFIAGQELGNGFSELNDPEDQAQRFKQQVAERAAGDEEAMPYDEDYIVALEHGLPPTAGEGIGIDRLVMLFTDSPSIRDVILFPLLRDV